MKKILHSPWLSVSLVIVGLIIGYSLVILNNNEAVAAWECPAKEHCTGENCAHDELCASGECSKDCPGNCGQEES